MIFEHRLESLCHEIHRLRLRSPQLSGFVSFLITLCSLAGTADLVVIHRFTVLITKLFIVGLALRLFAAGLLFVRHVLSVGIEMLGRVYGKSLTFRFLFAENTR
jgi:hypothetical protein